VKVFDGSTQVVRPRRIERRRSLTTEHAGDGSHSLTRRLQQLDPGNQPTLEDFNPWVNVSPADLRIAGAGRAPANIPALWQCPFTTPIREETERALCI